MNILALLIIFILIVLGEVLLATGTVIMNYTFNFWTVFGYTIVGFYVALALVVLWEIYKIKVHNKTKCKR